MNERMAQNEDMHVPYFRVSTEKQGRSKLGLEAQRKLIEDYIARDARRKLSAESFTDIASGRKDDRPQLHAAIALCKKRGATLLVAKLDRLARSQRLILDLRDSGVKFVIAEHPEMTEEVVGILSVLAESEAKRIRDRIREALAAKKRRGEALGKSQEEWAVLQAKGRKVSAKVRSRKAREQRQILAKTVAAYRKADMTLVEIGAELVKLKHQPPRGGEWHPAQVARLLA